MLQGRNIAFFIDVDNVGLSSEQYANIVEQLSGMGTILFGKIYGAGERKHKEIYDDADLKGYATARPMRVKRRGRKEFDARIFVDAVDAVSRVPAIDAVCIIAQPTDLVHLYSYMRSHGIKIIALDNADDASCAFIDEVIDLGVVVELKPPKKVAAKPAPKAEPVEEAESEVEPVEEVAPVEKKDLDRTDELLREIERLRALANAHSNEAPVEEAAEEEPVEEASEEPAEEDPSSIVEETHALLDKIAEMQEPEEEPVEEQAEPASEQPAHAPTPRASYTPSNDSDLIRRIEEIRKSNKGDDEEFIDEIRKLLDGLE